MGKGYIYGTFIFRGVPPASFGERLRRNRRYPGRGHWQELRRHRLPHSVSATRYWNP